MKVTTKQGVSVGGQFQPSRPLDYIYDPVFTFSGPKDYYKSAFESQKASVEYNVQPIFESMFSDMVRYPRTSLVLRPAHQMSRGIDPSYKGKLRAISQDRTLTAEVTGADRYKYFRRPLTDTKSGAATATRFPLLGVENVTDLGLVAPPTTAQKLRDQTLSRLSASGAAVTQARAVQTDFRESETQTRPWTPPYYTQGNQTPELLQLDRLTWGDGLPSGKHEVEIVERIRMKQAWEACLPPLDCEANIKKRCQLISDMEKSDWEFRKKEVDVINEERMKKSAKILEQHVLFNRDRLLQRMEFLEDEITKKKERKLEIIRHVKERALRKLCMKEKGFKSKQQKVQIVEQHLNQASDLYAPKKINGISFKNKNEVLSEDHINISSNDLQVEFEHESENQAVFFDRLAQPKKQTELCIRETRWTMENLATLHEDLQLLRKKEMKRETFHTQVVHEIHRVIHPNEEYPTVPLTPENLERLYQAAILMQRVIHGRAMQAQMQIGRKMWREIFEELKSSDYKASKKNLDVDIGLRGVLQNVIGSTVGKSISQTLNMLVAELLRIRNEGIAHNQALQAECDRWKREVKESGRRQKEIQRRHEHNLMFAQLLEVYQRSVDEFLESLMVKAREQEIKVQAYEYAKEMARMAKLQAALEEEAVEEPVSVDLLFEFIAPEGLRELARTCMLILKKKYMEAQHQLAEVQQPPTNATTQPDHKEWSGGGTISSLPSYSYQYPENYSSTNLATRTGHDNSERTEMTRAKASSMEMTGGDLSITEMKEAGQSSTEVTAGEVTFSDLSRSDGSSTEVTKGEVSFLELTQDGLSIEEKESSEAKESAPIVRFGLSLPASPEERLLARVMRDMCYVAGALLHTAAKILNKALQLSNIPKESFEEALRRTMLLINEVREEIFRLILPRRPDSEGFVLPSKIAPQDTITEAALIVEEIINRARERIGYEKEKLKTDSPRIKIDSELHRQSRQLVDEVVREAQREVFQIIAHNFLEDLFKEAKNRVDMVSGDWQSFSYNDL